jgi:putative inorganic carbon (hco3(-)) transporter
MLRTLFVLGLIAYGVRHSVRGAFYALLFYLWIAYFRPELWVWDGIVQSIPLSLLVGTVTLLATVMSGQLTFNARLALVGVTVGQSLVSTLLSDYESFSWPFWVDFAKSASMTWLIASLATDVKRLRLTMLVIALSLGFESAKQGWLQLLLNPGAKNFNEVSFLGDNNAVAIGMYVLVAFLVALGRTAGTRPERWLHRFIAVGSLYRGVVTYSRGGLLAGGSMALVYLVRSKRRVGAAIALLLLGLVIVPVLPDAFWERMGTMTQRLSKVDPFALEGEQDASFQGRLHFWSVAAAMAADRPLLGVGHNAFTQAYDKYDSSNGEFGEQRSVHSMWLGVLAELGYPGLLLLIANLVTAMLACRRARLLRGDSPDIVQLRELGIALEMSLVVIMVGGTFVIFQYTEVLWHVFGLSIALHRLVSRVPSQAVEPVRIPPEPMMQSRAIAAARVS